MILTDANLLLYACNVDASEHDTSRQWLETQLSGARSVLLRVAEP